MAKFSPISFITSTVDEGKKVVWPTRELIMRHTLMVIVSITIAVLLFAGIDYGFQKLVLISIQ